MLLYICECDSVYVLGICLLYKQRGLTPPRPSRKRACVGKCHHEKLFNLPAQKVQVYVKILKFKAQYEYVVPLLKCNIYCSEFKDLALDFAFTSR